MKLKSVRRSLLAFSIEDEEEGVVLMDEDFAPFRWRDDDDWNGWRALEPKFDARSELLDLDALREAAANALAAADAAVATSRAER